MAVEFRTTVATLPTGDDSSWDVTVGGWSETPIACIITWAENDGGTSANDHEKWCTGFAAFDGDSTYTYGCVNDFSKHNNPVQRCDTSPHNDAVLWATGGDDLNLVATAAQNSVLKIDSFISGGATFNYESGATNNKDGDTIVITFIVATNAYVGTFRSSAIWSTTENEITAPGFNPELLIGLCGTPSVNFGSRNIDVTRNIGLATGVTTSVTQASIQYFEDHLNASGASYNKTNNDTWLLDSWTSGSSLDVTEFTSNGFKVQASVSRPTSCVYLALDFDGEAEIEIGTGTFPTSTSGTHDEPASSMGFTPQFVMTAGGYNQSLNTLESTVSDLGGWCVSVSDDTNKYSMSTANEDASPTTNTESKYTAQSFLMHTGDGSAAYDATLDGFKSGYWTWDWQVSTPSTARYFIYFAVEESSSEHTLLADDIESASEVSAPAIGQEHALLADDVESASEVSVPDVGQEHALLANDVESASEVSAPELNESNILLADDIESASEVSVPAFGQEHALLANYIESSSEVSVPAIGQEHALLADDIESASEVSIPTVTESNILLADDVESTSEVSSPSVGQVHALLADDVESASEVSSPALAVAGVAGVAEKTPAGWGPPGKKVLPYGHTGLMANARLDFRNSLKQALAEPPKPKKKVISKKKLRKLSKERKRELDRASQEAQRAEIRPPEIKPAESVEPKKAPVKKPVQKPAHRTIHAATAHYRLSPSAAAMHVITPEEINFSLKEKIVDMEDTIAALGALI